MNQMTTADADQFQPQAEAAGLRAFGAVINPNTVRVHNLGRISLRLINGDTSPLRLRCTNPQCGGGNPREVVLETSDPAYDPNCDNMKTRNDEVQPEKGWRCSPNFGGCNGLMAIV